MATPNFVTRARLSWWSFCDETMLHGFGHASRSRTALETIVWCLFVCFCFGMAIYDTAVLYATYASQPTSTLVTTETNSTITIPSATLCVELVPYFLPLSASPNVSKIGEELVANVNNSATDFACTLSADAISLSYHLISAISILEYTEYFAEYFMDATWAGEQWSWAPVNNNSTLGGGLWSQVNNSMLEALYEFIFQNNIDLVQLTKTIGACMLNAMNVQLQFTSSKKVNGKGSSIQPTTSVNVTWSRDSITYVGTSASNDIVCAAINQSSGITFSTPADTLWIEVDQDYLYGDNRQPLYASGQYTPEAMHIHFNLLGRPFLDDGSADSEAIVTFQQAHGSYAYLDGYFKVYDAARNPCSVTPPTAFDCRVLCRTAHMVARCGCWPLIYFYLAPAYKPASVSVCVNGQPPNAVNQTVPRSACLDWNKTSSEEFPTLQCENACVRDCTTYSYTFVQTLGTYYNGETFSMPSTCPPNSTCLSITLPKFSYAQFTEKLSMELSDFLANFGGVIGLWFGGSLLAFAHVGVHALRSLWIDVGCQRKTKKPAVVTVNQGQIRSTY